MLIITDKFTILTQAKMFGTRKTIMKELRLRQSCLSLLRLSRKLQLTSMLTSMTSIREARSM